MEVSANYKVNGYWLGKWISNQREIRRGRKSGQTLTAEQIKLLDKIGMRWLRSDEIKWLQQYDRAKAYFDTHGNLDVSDRKGSPEERSIAG